MKKNKKVEFGGWSSSRGHATVILANSKECDDWRFEDTLERCYHQRSCKKCRRFAKPDEPDPCIGWLPNVKYACCGHGIKDEDYVMMDNGERMSLEEYCNLTGFIKPEELLS